MSGVKREWLGGQFVQIHLGLLEALDGDYETAAVVWAIHWHAGGAGNWWAATREEMQAATCLTEAKVKRALKRARSEGYVESSNESGYDRTLSWRVKWSEGDSPRIAPPGGNGQVEETATWRKPPPPTGGNLPVEREETSTSPSSKKIKTSSEGARDSASAAEFDEFWALYPRKVNKAKARTAFARALKRADLSVILAALREQSKGWTDPQFVPHPTTWLNGDRWADEAPAVNGYAVMPTRLEDLELADEQVAREWLKVHPLKPTPEEEALEEAGDWAGARRLRNERLPAHEAEAIRVVLSGGW